MTKSLLNLVFLNNRILTRIDDRCFLGLHKLKELTISGSNIQIFQSNIFDDLGNLTYLNLTKNQLFILDVGIFKNQGELKILDISKSNIKLTSPLFSNTKMLEEIYCDSFTICCIRPINVSAKNCSARQDDISSCSNLIENRFLAAFLWIFGLLAFFGNLSVLIYRGFIDRSIFAKSYFIFVYNLSLADLIMSIYMLIIAYHDAIYDGNYVWNDYSWKINKLCLASGILSMISNEASLIFVCLVTLERFCCVKFAFREFKISRRIAVYLCISVYLSSVLLALLPTFFHSSFFSRSGVCIGIPLTKDNNEGLEYATVIFLGLNFLFSVVIVIGQIIIFVEVRKATKSVQTSQEGRNLAVAKRLAVVVITDCLCWIPIGVLVILSLGAVPTPRDIYAWAIIFILPINAAVNPYLYTLTQIDKEKLKKCMNRRTV